VESTNRAKTRLYLVIISLAVALSGCTSGGGGGGKGGAAGGAAGGGTAGAAGGAAGGGAGGMDSPGTTFVKLMVGPTDIQLTEGSPTAGKLQVSIDRPYSQDITVTIVSANPAVATVIPETVTFPANTMTPQVVQVMAPVDDNTVMDRTTLTVFSQETGSKTVTVEVADISVQALLATPPNLSTTEGRAETVSYRLAFRPASAVVVTLTSSQPAKLTPTPATLTFDASNYSIPQAVAFTAVKDDDAINEQVKVTASATGNIPDLDVNVEIIDINAVNIDVAPSSVSLMEGSGVATSGTFTVALTRAPAADVTVSVASSASDKAIPAPASLTFNAVNWSIPQIVTATAVPDGDARDEVVTFRLSAVGMDSVPSRDVVVTVHDTDSQSVKATPLMLTTTEGMSGTFTVALSLKPDGDTTVNVYSQNPGKLQVLPPILHFDATTFNTPQTVTVQALEDDDLVNDTVNVTLVAASAKSNVNVAVAIADNDHQSIQLIPAGGGTALTMQETRLNAPDSNSTVGVRLAYRPAEVVTVNFDTSVLGKLAFAPRTLSFAPADYSIPKFVVLNAPHDIDTVDDYVTFTATSGDIGRADLPVTIIDTDVQNLDLSANPGTLAVAENFFDAQSVEVKVFTTAPLTVKLIAQPAADVTINFASSDTAKVLVPASCTIPGGVASGNAYTEKGCTVQVAAAPDKDGRSDSAMITISALVGGVALTQRQIPVMVTDNDKQALMVTTSDLGAISEGEAASFMVALKLDPVVPATVSLFSDRPGDFDVSPPTLTFAGSMQPQMVTVRAMNDDDMQDYTGIVTVQGAAAGVSTAWPVKVKKTNTDMQTIVLTSGSSVTLPESSSIQVGVRLSYRPIPTKDESITFDTTLMDKTSASAYLSPSPATVKFGNATYATNQFVTLNAPRDFTVGSKMVTLRASSDGVYDNMLSAAPVTVPVTVTDIDTLNFRIVSGVPVAPIGEGTQGSFVIGLTATPVNPITPTLGTPSGAPFMAALDDSTCKLSTNVSTCKVNVTALADANALDETATVTISDAAITANATVSVSSDDDDHQAIMLGGGSPAMIHEKMKTGDMPDMMANRTSFTVKLGAKPAASTTVTVTVSPSATDGISVYNTMLSAGDQVSPAATTTTLTFDPSEWPTSPSMDPTNPAGGPTKTVYVRGVLDKDLRTDPFSIRVSAGALSVPDQFFDITEIDDDTQSIVISKAVGTDPSSLTCLAPTSDNNLDQVNEGGGQLNICVSLKYQPLSNTVVDVTASAIPMTEMDILTPLLSHLMFTTLNYDSPQIISFTTGPDDRDAEDEDGHILLSSSGFAAMRDLTFTIHDGNSQAVVLSGGGITKVVAMDGSVSWAITVTHGMSATFQMHLKFQPVGATMVNCTKGMSDPIMISPSSLTFTAGNGGVDQDVTVTASATPSSGSYVLTCSGSKVPEATIAVTVN